MHHDLQTLLEKLIQFRDERDWAQFQTAKNLALSISLEAAYDKISKNAGKYPADLVRGKSFKYTEY